MKRTGSQAIWEALASEGVELTPFSRLGDKVRRREVVADRGVILAGGEQALAPRGPRLAGVGLAGEEEKVHHRRFLRHDNAFGQANVAAVSYHFRTKNDLLYALVDPVLDRLDALVARHRRTPESPEQVRTLLSEYLQILTDNHSVAAWIDGRHLGARLVYYRVPAQLSPRAPAERRAAHTLLVDMLEVKPGTEFERKLLERAGGTGRLTGNPLHYRQEVAGAVLQFGQQHLLALLKAA